MPEESEKKNGWRKMLSVLGKPKNLARTVISSVPGGGVVLEAASQIDSENTELALAELQLADEKLGERLSSLASSTGGAGWVDNASEMMARTVDLAVLYDDSFHPGGKTGKELYQSVAHGCAVGDGLVVCAKEAFNLRRVFKMVGASPAPQLSVGMREMLRRVSRNEFRDAFFVSGVERSFQRDGGERSSHGATAV